VKITSGYNGGRANLLEGKEASYTAWYDSLSLVPWLYSGKVRDVTYLIRDPVVKARLTEAIGFYMTRAYVASLRMRFDLFKTHSGNYPKNWEALRTELVALEKLKLPTNEMAVAFEKKLTQMSINLKCPENWIQYDATCFKYYSADKNFDEAETACTLAIEGGHLTSFHSQNEWTFVKSRVLAAGKSAWIGAKRKPDGNGFKQGPGKGSDIWRWMDGSEWNPSHTFFRPGEPSGGGEDCVHIWDGIDWNDLPCQYRKPYICRKDLGNEAKRR